MALTVEVESGYFDAKRPAAIQTLATKHNFDGFRPGQAPEAVVVRELGEDAVLWETAKATIGAIYPTIISQEKIDALGRPDVSITKIARGNPLVFTLTTAIVPPFELPDYQAIARNVQPTTENGGAEKRRTKIAEELVDKTSLVLPAILINAELEQMIRELEAKAAAEGKKLEEELKTAGKTIEGLRADWRTVAEQRIKINLIFEKIARAEKLEPSADKVEADVTAILAEHPKAERAVVRSYVRHALTNNLVWEFLTGQK